MSLYRGELFNNRTRRTYGLSWTTRRKVAVAFAENTIRRHAPGGTVLLRAEVPASAIIAKIVRRHDRYGENEILVDRRGLKPGAVRVVQTYPHID